MKFRIIILGILFIGLISCNKEDNLPENKIVAPKSYHGSLRILNNPCTTTPCLPCAIWWLETDTSNFVLSIDNSWKTEDTLVFLGNKYNKNDSVTIEGVEKINYDIYDTIFYELEISKIILIQ
ncbi:MAG: hypothetical protein K9J13_12400 [Saprospiraceae bacterium]|nr:hypothetical protein [Saprospiraceae bacterium]